MKIAKTETRHSRVLKTFCTFDVEDVEPIGQNTWIDTGKLMRPNCATGRLNCSAPSTGTSTGATTNDQEDRAVADGDPYLRRDAAALYIDGKLRTAQHSVDELALELLGVTVVCDPAFMQGQTRWSGVAKTLDEVCRYRQTRERLAVEAARLREQAAALISKAEELEKGPIR